MARRTLLTVLVAAVAAMLAFPAAALNLTKEMKKLPEEDRQVIKALMIFMAEDEIEAYFELEDSAARTEFLKETGYYRKWEKIRDEMRPHVIRGDVVKGMNKDELWMTWGKPIQVRQTFYKKNYVDIYNYFFYEDRKGNAIPTSDPDDPKSYNRPQWNMNVYFHNDRVVSILEEGELFNPSDLEDKPVQLLDADDQKALEEKKKAEEEAAKAAAEGEEGEGEGEGEGGEEEPGSDIP